MRTYSCNCGNTLFYDNNLCLVCQSEVGFCPVCREMVTLVPQEGGDFRCGNSNCGALLAKCANYAEHDVCNRCIQLPSTADTRLCDCCRFNDTIPDLTIAENLQKWYRLEAAKRRLFYDLAHLGLPYGTAADGIDPPLTFDFKADVIPRASFWRRMSKAQQVFTGHANGRITINIREADDVEREKLRVEFGETQRTLIGHFRHEIGHYYWDVLVKNRREAECVAVFGDHNQPTYGEALEQYYTAGPPADWAQRHVSAYASMHPWEDFAETWAAYLDMVSALDTAQWHGFGGQSDPVNADLDAMLKRYQELGISLNEINRSQGLLDLVPEVFVPAVAVKMRFVHELVLQGRSENGALQPPEAVDTGTMIAADVPVPNAQVQTQTAAPQPAVAAPAPQVA